jgi:hypothetical protein
MTIAHWLMKLVRVVTPDNRAEWARAMSAEFAALDRKAGHIAWAAGCLATAGMWRLQASALYLALLAALPVLWNVAISTLIFMASTSYAFSQPISHEEMGRLWLALSGADTQAAMLLVSAALCAYRPQHALFSVLVLWIATGGAPFLTMFGPEFAPLLANAPFSSENNHPALPNIVMALTFAGGDMWPVVLGGFAGWAFALGTRSAVAASAAIAFALILGFTEFFLNPGETDPLLSTFATAAYSLTAATLILAIAASSVSATRKFLRVWTAAP